MENQKVNPFKSAAIKLFVAAIFVVIGVKALHLAGRDFAWLTLAAVAIAYAVIMAFLKRRQLVL